MLYNLREPITYADYKDLKKGVDRCITRELDLKIVQYLCTRNCMVKEESTKGWMEKKKIIASSKPTRCTDL